MRGQARCHLHGGGTPQARRAAGRRVAIEAARREALRLGGSVDANPLDVLLEAVREAWSNVAAYRLAVSTLDVTVSRDGAVAVPEHFDDKDSRDPALAHILVDLYNSERDRATRYAKLAIDAGVEERLVRVQESQAAEAWAAVTAGLEEAVLTEEQRAAFTRGFARQLRAGG